MALILLLTSLLYHFFLFFSRKILATSLVTRITVYSLWHKTCIILYTSTLNIYIYLLERYIGTVKVYTYNNILTEWQKKLRERKKRNEEKKIESAFISNWFSGTFLFSSFWYFIRFSHTSSQNKIIQVEK